MNAFDGIEDRELREIVRSTLQRACDLRFASFVAVTCRSNLFSCDTWLSDNMADFLRRAAECSFLAFAGRDVCTVSVCDGVEDARLRTLLEQAVNRAAALGNVYCVLVLQLSAEPLATRSVTVSRAPASARTFMEACFHVALMAIAGARAVADAYGSASPPRERIN